MSEDLSPSRRATGATGDVLTGVPWDRVAHDATLAVIGVAIFAIVAQLVIGFPYTDLGGTDWGADLRGYVEASRSWLAGDGFYLPRQLHGPYPIELGDVLYPPTMLYLFIPFLVLPYQLWWVLAVGLLGFVVWSWRPALWAVALILVCLAFPDQPVLYFRGAPVIVFAALVAAALRWKWPGALILLKPSILPFALIGIRTRGWWITAGILLVLTLPLIPLIPDWLRAVVDARGPAGWLYSVKDLPLLMVPVIAYLGRTRNPQPAALADAAADPVGGSDQRTRHLRGANSTVERGRSEDGRSGIRGNSSLIVAEVRTTDG